VEVENDDIEDTSLLLELTGNPLLPYLVDGATLLRLE
jgi:hypothetical protein